MANTYTTLGGLFTAIANAIRAKKGTSGQIVADTFPDEIASIQTGITPTGTKQITQAGETDVTSFAKANVPSATLSVNTPTVNSSGLITASASLSQSGWIGSAPQSKTLQLTTQGGKTVMPSTSQQTAVANGRYTTGSVYVAGDSNLVSGNIRSGVSIFGVSGSYSGKRVYAGSVTLDEPSPYLTLPTGQDTLNKSDIQLILIYTEYSVEYGLSDVWIWEPDATDTGTVTHKNGDESVTSLYQHVKVNPVTRAVQAGFTTMDWGEGFDGNGDLNYRYVIVCK